MGERLHFRGLDFLSTTMRSSSEPRENAMTVDDYFEGPETLNPMELIHGVVREPPAPSYGHQTLVTRVTVLLDAYVRGRALGHVCVSPVDVVLDRDQALVLQPDVVFVSAERSRIISDRIWGAPDLVVEVLSRRTAVRDRTEKLNWYLQYGVRECWFLDPVLRAVTIVTVESAAHGRTFCGPEIVTSQVLTSLSLTAEAFFD
jgi:Uma2 family endonuclease